MENVEGLAGLERVAHGAPEGAVVVPGARTIRQAWKPDLGISIQTPLIVKYRDAKTDAATSAPPKAAIPTSEWRTRVA